MPAALKTINSLSGTDLPAGADRTKIDGVEALADVTDATNVNAAGAVMESDFDAQTVLAATLDNTPVALVVGEATVVGRATGGNVAALSGATLEAIVRAAAAAFTATLDLNAQTITNVGNVDGRDVSADGAVTDAIVAANTDAQVGVNIFGAFRTSGAWTDSMQADGPRVRRTAAAAAEVLEFPIDVPSRSTASRGRQLTSLDVKYDVNTALLEDVTVQVFLQTLGADGAAQTFVEQAGTYDLAHDTAAERGDNTGAPELHLLTYTITTPAYIGANAKLWVRLTVDGDVGAAGVFDLRGVQAKFTETLVDNA